MAADADRTGTLLPAELLLILAVTAAEGRQPMLLLFALFFVVPCGIVDRIAEVDRTYRGLKTDPRTGRGLTMDDLTPNESPELACPRDGEVGAAVGVTTAEVIAEGIADATAETIAEGAEEDARGETPEFGCILAGIGGVATGVPSCRLTPIASLSRSNLACNPFSSAMIPSLSSASCCASLSYASSVSHAKDGLSKSSVDCEGRHRDIAMATAAGV